MFLWKYKWFTLVELIVVITILSILATIAFLSFSQRSAEARDTLRKSDITTLSKSIGSNAYRDPENLTKSIGTTTSQHMFSSGSIYDTLISSGSIVYNAWYPNVEVFGNDKFLDPLSWNPYIISYVRWGFGAYYQIGASLENNTAIVEGTYFKQESSDLNGIIKESSGSSAIVDGWVILPY